MRKGLLFVICLAISIYLSAQEKMYIHTSDHITSGALISEIDSVYFSSDGSIGYFKIGDILAQYWLCNVDSISFGDNSNTIYIDFNGSSVSVYNPLAFEGVYVKVSGADVTIASTTEVQDINYQLSGTTNEGMFKIYSEKRFNLLFNGANISNSNGPAVNIQAKNKVSVTLIDGTVNSLTDGSVYADVSAGEDQDAAFFSEGKLVFNGSGSLTINGIGTDKHALCSDDKIEIYNGSIIIASAQNDGIHANDGITINNGDIDITASGDAIDGADGYVIISGGSVTTLNKAADVQGITCDSIIDVSGGIINMTLSGNQSKGLKSNQIISLRGGDITINTSGGVALESSGSGYDASYCTAITCDSIIVVDGANLTITSTGTGGKGISSDYDISIISGIVKITTTGNGSTYTNSLATKDSYHATCLTADRNISILGGTVTLSSSGSGGKGITCDGNLIIGDASNSPLVNITTSGSKITVSSSSGGSSRPGSTQTTANYDEAKAIKCDGAVQIKNGIITISSADDGIKSETSITINTATLSIVKSVEAIESPLITINGGNIDIIASNDGLNGTSGTVSGGAEYDDGSFIYLNNGTVIVNCTNGDAIDCNGSIVMTGGIVIANGPSSGVEEACDFNGTFKVNGGLFIGAGSNSTMTKSISSSSSQYNFYISSQSIISSSTLLHIQNSSGEDVLTFKPKYGGYKFLFSSSDLKNGSTYSIYTGGTSTGTESDGLYTGGTYSGGTLKKTCTISSIVTSVSF